MPVFNCSHCGRQMMADEGYAGMMAPCPSCGQRVMVPAASEPRGSVAPPVPLPPTPQSAPRPRVVAQAPAPAPGPVPIYVSPRRRAYSDAPPVAPGAGCAHYLMALLASVVALGCGTAVAYFMVQDELATRPGVHVDRDKMLQACGYLGGIFTMGFSLVSFVISLFVAAIMVGVFKRRFRPSYLTSYSIVIALCGIGFGLGMWSLWNTPQFRQIQKTVREQVARQREAREGASPKPKTP